VFTTTESAALGTAIAVRHSSRELQPLSRDKLFISIYESNKHRPTALTDADGLVGTIISLILQQHSAGVISRAEIITLATAVLERFDRTAATMYAAYHKA